MAVIRDQTLTTTVSLDGNRYINCRFEGAELTYAGGPPPRFDQCQFDKAKFVFTGPAKNTVALLRTMAPAHTNMRELVRGLIPELQD